MVDSKSGAIPGLGGPLLVDAPRDYPCFHWSYLMTCSCLLPGGASLACAVLSRALPPGDVTNCALTAALATLCFVWMSHWQPAED